MNKTTEIATYCNVLVKLPKEYIEKNPDKVLGGALFIIALPYFEKAVHQVGYNFRYWVKAKYGTSEDTLDPSEKPVDSDPAA